MNELWSVEVNLNDDPMNSCAWHIDLLKSSLKSNFNAAVKGTKLSWVILDICNSHEQAHLRSVELQQAIAKLKRDRGIPANQTEPYSGMARFLEEEDKKAGLGGKYHYVLDKGQNKKHNVNGQKMTPEQFLEPDSLEETFAAFAKEAPEEIK